MNPIPSALQKKRGSALLTVVMLTAMMAILTASMLSYTLSEKRGNERNRAQLRAKNMAENISVYAAEQLTTKLYRTRATAAMAFMTGSNAISLPDSSGTSSVLSNVNYAVVSGMEVRAGMEAPTAYTLITDSTSTNYGLQVSTATVPIIAKATVTHPALGTMTSHVLQEMEIAMTPLFQFGMFYNMDMELYPSAAFTVAGPVHTNGRLIVHPDGSSTNPIRFTDRVTAYAGIYWDTALKAKPRNGTGGENLATEANGNVYFTHTNGTTTADLKGTGTMAGKWRDHKYGQTTESATTLNNFKTNATATWNGNVRTNQHGVTKLELPGVGSYNETNLASTPEDDRNNGRAIIEPPNAKKWFSAAPYPAHSPAYTTPGFYEVTDDADSKESKISWKAGLYIMVNPDDDGTPRSGTLPDGNTYYVLPRSYRAFINSIDSSNVHTVTEVVLPGQPSYGYNSGADGTIGTSDDYMYHNLLPNRYTEVSAGGAYTGNQVLRIPQQYFSAATGATISNAGGYPISTATSTVLNITGSAGQILPGQFVTIGSYSYLVVAGMNGGAGAITISGGPLAIITDGAAITVGNPASGAGLLAGGGGGYRVRVTGGVAVGLTDVPVDTGTGKIYPGNTVTISGRKYVVAAVSAAAPHALIRLASGIRVTTATDTTAITVDPFAGSLGTGEDYITAAAVAANQTGLTVDTGSGTVLPGDIVAIGARQYVVVNATTGSPVTNITIALPGLIDAVLDNTPVIVDPFRYSGYSTSLVAPSGAMSDGTTFPPDTIGSAPYTYFPSDAYFYDLRRANGNRGVTSISGTQAYYNRFAVNYVPREIAKIDFDLTRFKMMVNRTMSAATTSTVYDLRSPTLITAAEWAHSIYNDAGTTAAYGLGMGATFNVFPDTADNVGKMRQDPFRLYYAPGSPETAATIDRVTGVDGTPNPAGYAVPVSILYDGTIPDAWYDGIAIYVHSVDAEKRAQTAGVPDRVDSGVRLWNGRGNVASLTATNKTGFTFVTNDAVYCMGHFNADGDINSVVTSSTNPGGYSAQYPDNSTEKLCAIMGDAFSPLSQPVWSTQAGGQTSGWNDSLSALPAAASGTGWRTGTSATSVLVSGGDGVLISDTNGPKVGLLPNQSYPGTLGTAKTLKLPVVETEISAALLCGLVPSNTNATGLSDNVPYAAVNGVQSGGANNFPRMQEAWGGIGLYIRGSIVGLFESRVAMEPFTNSRNYSAPGRFWGLHNDFRTANHDLPLEPIVIGCTRKRYMEMTAAEYAAKKTEIEALPH